jgi:hypothetical protein
MLKKSTILIPALLMATLSGCSSTFRFFKTQSYLNTDLIEASYDATDELKDELARKIPKGSLIVVSTLLNVKKNPNETSSFGRIISDQIATALHNSGYQIIAMDLPIDLFMMKDAGELQLSEEDKALLRRYNAAVLVGGVYAPGKQNAYITLRAVNRFTKQVIASTDFSIALGPDVKTLLKTKDTESNFVPIGSAGSVAEPILEDAASTVLDVESAPPKQEEMPTAPAVESKPPKLEEIPAAPAVESKPPKLEEIPADNLK